MIVNNKPIKFIDLSLQQQRILPRLQKRIAEVLAHGRYIMGPEVNELEEKLCRFNRVKHTISCANGTDALLMVLMAYGIGPGDAVFTTSFSFVATAEVIALLGATPVFVDIDPDTYNINPVALEKAIQAVLQNDESACPFLKTMDNLKPKGIIPVDIFGLPADYEKICRLGKKYDLFVLADGAQSFGSEYRGKKAASLGDAATTSFFPAKPLGCYGDGGAVFTNNDELAQKLISIRVHGKGKEKYDNVRIGINGRLDTLQAAVLLEKLEIFPEEFQTRNRVADLYTKLLKDYVKIQAIPDDRTCAWAQYSIKKENRGMIQKKLSDKGIPSAVYYPTPLHLQPAFSYLGHKPGSLPVSENLSKDILSLPMHPYLKDEQIRHITDVIVNPDDA
ncbi:DegT/DnrJ/EryC1/StrS family aminotransferase [Desulfobacula sp.]|uniref:DegT/DnrJ/EryC1/StrS family aminotransferase n=1 Tax=Desulfobacula sp. TaxID=2593537 RepID=UPI0039B83D65